MKITIEPTSELIKHNGRDCCAWKGRTEHGTPCIVLVAAVLVDIRQSELEFAGLEAMRPSGHRIVKDGETVPYQTQN